MGLVSFPCFFEHQPQVYDHSAPFAMVLSSTVNAIPANVLRRVFSLWILCEDRSSRETFPVGNETHKWCTIVCDSRNALQLVYAVQSSTVYLQVHPLCNNNQWIYVFVWWIFWKDGQLFTNVKASPLCRIRSENNEETTGLIFCQVWMHAFSKKKPEKEWTIT